MPPRPSEKPLVTGGASAARWYGRPISTHLIAAWLVFGNLVWTGCAGYRLGPTSGVEPGTHAVRIEPFHNETWEPRVTENIATALREQIQQEGTYRLATHGEADVVLSGVIRRIDRHEQSFFASDTLTVRDYRLEVTAHVIALEQATGRKLLDPDISGHTLMRVMSDLPSAERQAMPLLAANLARNITSLLVDGTW